uniref:Protein MEI2-like 2 n=1 Tax=Rhizophora mucronata TaxID=61149 RepID=A0A2P2QA95_RHIMU
MTHLSDGYRCLNGQIVKVPAHQTPHPQSGKELAGIAYLHSLSLNYRGVLQRQPCPGFSHMPVKQLFHC